MILHCRYESARDRRTESVRAHDPSAPRLAVRWLFLPASALLAVTLGSGCDSEANCTETATCSPIGADARADGDADHGEAGGNAGASGGAGSGGGAGADASSGRGGAGGSAGKSGGGAGGSAGSSGRGADSGADGSAGTGGGGAGGSADASGGSAGRGGTAGADASGGSGGSAGSGATAGSAGFAGTGGAAGTATVDAGGGGPDSGVDGGPDVGVLCSPNATQCSGNGVQTCNASGQWEPAIACPFVCSGGVCTGVCSPTMQQCSGNGVQTCGPTGQWGAAAPCAAATPYCAQGTCTVPPSCEGGGAGQSNCASGESCCTSLTVPGGTYNRSNDASYPATVSDFRLDKYEITVGRFRKFVAAYSQNMTASGAGKNPNNPNDPGWDTAWNATLPADAAALTTLQCTEEEASHTWTQSVAGNESRPINCIPGYLAQAFCIWDGGRLPTEAEWNYAAAGGSEQRVYPWGSTMLGADANLAVYACYYNGTGPCTGVTNIAPVGSVSAGNGKWGQADLAGNVWEWVQDTDAPYAGTCNDCANLTPGIRVIRGGSYQDTAAALLSSNRSSAYPGIGRFKILGARCARTR